MDCDDPDCSETATCSENDEEDCDNGEDDDGDTAVDCDDSDCSEDAACLEFEEVCDNGEDVPGGHEA